MSLPLVSCIMPTTLGRAEFVEKSVEYFRRQTYENRQLVIAGEHLHNSRSAGNPGTDKVTHPPIAYLKSPVGLTLGAKRNWIIDQTGGLIAHWDDDDWYGPDRLADQVARFTSGVGVEVCGIEHPLFYDLWTGRSFKYHYRGTGGYLYSATLMYTREFWARSPFPDVQVGAGNPFILGPGRRDHAAFTPASWYVGIAHDSNNSPKDFARQEYGAQSEAATVKRIGDDWPFYQSLREKLGVAA